MEVFRAQQESPGTVVTVLRRSGAGWLISGGNEHVDFDFIIHCSVMVVLKSLGHHFLRYPLAIKRTMHSWILYITPLVACIGKSLDGYLESRS